MIAPIKEVEPPSDDKRWKIVNATMRRNGYDRNCLIEALHTVQESFGCLDEEALKYVAASLNAPLGAVYGVATFYHFFTLKPPGRHNCVVCTGTACYIKGANDLIKYVEQTVGISPGQTTADGQVSLLSARCLGSCGLAPAVVYDGEVAGKVGVEQLKAKVEEWLSDDA
jgi:bidirectional [NiFe] hydrogenase diaphorase subunit